jgi:hypothetical protein
MSESFSIAYDHRLANQLNNLTINSESHLQSPRCIHCPSFFVEFVLGYEHHL